ncbi:putative nuclease with TOPRIM domain [Neobacillus niacini]|uniref:hypothetical protein n=1 Tax=Neobacillus driksii TaxID=3035913 RepID=UPI00278B3977|nr:hypothetical protein [Neobacillus niacini]MDQ0976626.1 putative nuclease with TOPRIM domain [Neobacillus niacini]
MFVKKLFPMFNADLGSGGGSTPPAQDPPATDPPAQDPPKDTMIPKTRFDEVNNKLKEMADKVAEFEKAQADAKALADQKELDAKKEQGKFEELYLNTQKELDTYKQYESRTKELEGTILKMVETKLESVPKEMHDLVPTNLTAEGTLDWLNKAEAKGIFGKPEVKEIGKPSNKSNESPKVDKSNMSALDKILSGLGK